jgi:carotenoid cleavage dioxygenase
MNAYEDEAGNVILDICRYERMFEKDTYGPFGDSLATLDRWTVNPTTRKVTEERIDDRGQEFPRCHPGLNSKPYRYGYAVAVEPGAFPRILKHDMTTGTTQEFDLGPGRHSGEPFFIPRENAQSEDDGYLMSYVYDQGRNNSELLILDARDPAAKPLAQVLLPARVPYGFHGSWIADGWDGPSV